MKIIVDTCIWSLALRRKGESSGKTILALENLITESRVQMLGPIRQEILSGIKSEAQFILLSDYLKAFPDLPLQSEDYECAARFFNICRSKGIQGSNTDFLICAVAQRYGMPVFTSDLDFFNFRPLLNFELFLE